MDYRIERAAKALHAHGVDNLCNDVLWDNLHQSEADQFRSWARAALEAASLFPQEDYVMVPVELTDAMMDAAEGCHDEWPATTWKKAWSAMIAARPEIPND